MTQSKQDAAWQELCKHAPIERALALLCGKPGVKVPRGSTKAKELQRVMLELGEMLFKEGLMVGHWTALDEHGLDSHTDEP